MRYYRIEFLSAPADEGEGWIYKQYKKCDFCGLNYLDYFSEFLVPEDTIERVQAEVWEYVDEPLLAVAGLLLAEKSFAEKMMKAGISGFQLKDAELIYIDDVEDVASALPHYYLMSVIGRCHTNDVWYRVVSVCHHCKSPKTERVKSHVRKIILKSPFPSYDMCRSKEATTGLIVSDNFVKFVQENWSNYDEYIKFLELDKEE